MDTRSYTDRYTHKGDAHHLVLTSLGMRSTSLLRPTTNKMTFSLARQAPKITFLRKCSPWVCAMHSQSWAREMSWSLTSPTRSHTVESTVELTLEENGVRMIRISCILQMIAYLITVGNYQHLKLEISLNKIISPPRGKDAWKYIEDDDEDEL